MATEWYPLKMGNESLGQVGCTAWESRNPVPIRVPCDELPANNECYSMRRLHLGHIQQPYIHFRAHESPTLPPSSIHRRELWYSTGSRIHLYVALFTSQMPVQEFARIRIHPEADVRHHPSHTSCSHILFVQLSIGPSRMSYVVMVW
jgi:hypothetical protein